MFVLYHDTRFQNLVTQSTFRIPSKSPAKIVARRRCSNVLKTVAQASSSVARAELGWWMHPFPDRNCQYWICIYIYIHVCMHIFVYIYNYIYIGKYPIFHTRYLYLYLSRWIFAYCGHKKLTRISLYQPNVWDPSIVVLVESATLGHFLVLHCVKTDIKNVGPPPFFQANVQFHV